MTIDYWKQLFDLYYNAWSQLVRNIVAVEDVCKGIMETKSILMLW